MSEDYTTAPQHLQNVGSFGLAISLSCYDLTKYIGLFQAIPNNEIFAKSNFLILSVFIKYKKYGNTSIFWLSSKFDNSNAGGHWGFANSGYQPIFGAAMRKLNIVSADCGYLLHFCGMQIFLQNQYKLLKIADLILIPSKY